MMADPEKQLDDEFDKRIVEPKKFTVELWNKWIDEHNSTERKKHCIFCGAELKREKN